LGIRHKTVKSSGDKLYASEWNEPHVIESGSSFPSNPSEGDLFYRSDEHRIYYFNGSEWKPVADIPLGHVKLPEPSSSDWVSPDGANASSQDEGIIASDDTEVSTTSESSVRMKTLTFPLTKITRLVANFKAGGSGAYVHMRIYLRKSGAVVWDSGWEHTVSQEYELHEYHPFVEADQADLYLYTTNSSVPVYNQIFRVQDYHGADSSIDDKTDTYWSSDPPNEPGAWLKIDTGSLQITGAIRIYFPDPTHIPESFKIEGSEDGATWETLLTGQTGSEGWNTYTFNARYLRYLRITVEDYGTANGIKIAETDYYSRITERVAALHGHGSGVVRFRRGHGERLSDDVRREVSEVLNAFRQASAQEKFTKLEMYLLLLEKRLRMLEDLTGV